MSRGLVASAAVATPEAWRAAPLLAALRAQDVAPRLEIVIAAPPPSTRARVARGTGFAALTLLDRDPLADLAGTRAALARACTGPVVLATETHCLPEPAWAGALARAHAGGAAAAGPVVHNANPDLRLVGRALRHALRPVRAARRRRREDDAAPQHLLPPGCPGGASTPTWSGCTPTRACCTSASPSWGTRRPRAGRRTCGT